ncbi:hypothetical protein [Pseudomonas arsenicoxydans]|uniref:Uncharacterized protein n=1 Tax=Pseudomonas arsenicoxydans TaxID=702115 RepID=A0A4P6G3Z3_9PSED|nr:hypothetical protein [Pseudomonas arsenicoxydans]QAY85368.1 hypothetical protein CUN61_15815 [Pseudomonas arsenicoxydans]
METYKKYQAAKLEVKRATDWLGNKVKIDSQDGRPYMFANVKFSAQYCGQSYAGATNYHDSPEAFNAAMAEVIRRDFDSLAEKAFAILSKKESEALIACKDDLAAVQAEIEEAESAA